MPHTLTIKLLNGDELKYSVRAMSGGAKFMTHRARLESLVLSHFDLEIGTHYVEFIHDDDDDAYVMAFREKYYRKVGFLVMGESDLVWCPPATDMTDEEILLIRDEKRAPWSLDKYTVKYNMMSARRYTADTTIFAIVQVRRPPVHEESGYMLAEADGPIPHDE